MDVRMKRILVRVMTHGVSMALLLSGAALGTVSKDPGWSVSFGLILLIYLATMRVNPVPLILERKLIQLVECDACGESFDMVSTWSCGCGFVHWKPRHAFSRCSNCKGEFNWVQCPRCENGINL